MDIQRRPFLDRDATTPGRTQRGSVAARVAPLVDDIIGTVPVVIEFWDGSRLGPTDGSEPGRLILRSPTALRRIVWAPGELGVARAFVAGDLDFEGDLLAGVSALRPVGQRLHRPTVRTAADALRICAAVGVIGPPPPPPPEEAAPHGRRHSKSRDAQAISHHYDVGNDFYRIVLGESMTYSCARFVSEDMTLTEAQAAKHELICRKLGLHESGEGTRLLDVGCGWGSMALHAAAEHGAEVVGITLSAEQAEAARARVEQAGLGDQVTIRLQDYRDLGSETFDVISSVGMFEHVGSERMAEYFTVLRSALRPGGRLLNHAISSIGGSRIPSRSFIGRYVFPDGELIDVGEVVVAMESAGFEVRDVEALREHYARTLRRWVENLQDGWEDAVALVGEGRARVWLLYMAASAIGFTDGGLGLHQVLGVVTDADGSSGMPPTRIDWN